MTRTLWTTIAIVFAVTALAAYLPTAAMGQDVQFTTVVAGAAPDKPAPADANAAESPLNQVREELSAILKLTAPDGKLALDRESWKAALAEEANATGETPNAAPNVPAGIAMRIRGGIPQSDFGKLLAKVQAKCGSRSGGSSMSNTRSQGSFSGGSLEGYYTNDENFLDLQLREQGVHPALTLRFHTGDTGTGIQLMDEAGDLVFILNQDADGAISLVHVTADQVIRYKGKSYVALCKDRRDYVEKQLVPLMTRVGVAMPMTAFSAPIRAAILEILKGKPANFAELIAKLDSDKVAERDAATKALSEAFLVCHKELQAALDSPTGSAETKARIQEVLRQNRPRLEQATVIEAMGLLHDKDLLEEMLKAAKTDADRQALTAALEKAKSSPQTKPAK
jgi:hypothetical protein